MAIGHAGRKVVRSSWPGFAKWGSTAPWIFSSFRAAAALAVSGTVLGGCGSAFKYYTHAAPSGSDTYFKVPSSWGTIGSATLISAIDPRLSAAQVRQVESRLWIMAFDMGTTATPKARNLSLLAPSVFGEVVARPLSAAEKSSYSTASLRSELLNVDPIAAAHSGNPFFKIISNHPAAQPGGLKGNSFVVDIRSPSGVQYTIAQKGLLDAKHGWVYVIGVGCQVKCFVAHRGAIDAVLNSWNVKENL